MQRNGLAARVDFSSPFLVALKILAESKVKAMGLVDFGCKELFLSEREMPGLTTCREEFGSERVQWKVFGCICGLDDAVCGDSRERSRTVLVSAGFLYFRFALRSVGS